MKACCYLSRIIIDLSLNEVRNVSYMIGQDPSFQDKAIFKTLDSAPEHSLKNITEMALSFGSEKINSIAEMMVSLKEYEIALT